jgi:hypothetical protein
MLPFKGTNQLKIKNPYFCLLPSAFCLLTNRHFGTPFLERTGMLLLWDTFHVKSIGNYKSLS